MALLDRLHAFAERLGLSPKVFDQLALTATAVVGSVILTGEVDLTQLKIAAVGTLYAIVGFAAPAVAGLKQKQLVRLARGERVPPRP